MKTLVVSAWAEKALNAQSISIHERDSLFVELHHLLQGWSFAKSETGIRHHALKLDCLPLMLQFQINDTEVCLAEVISLHE